MDKAFSVGQRVKIHPATDVFMMGERYGSVVKCGTKNVMIKGERSALQFTFRIAGDNLEAC